VSHIHFIGGEKGGVGKSVVARVLGQWFIDHSLPFAGIDGDRSHGVLLRSYAEFSQPVDLSEPNSADQIFDRALGADRRVLIDLPAQSMRGLAAWLEGANVLGLAKEMGITLSYWHVTDGGFASVNEIEKAVAFLGDRTLHKVVKNFGRSQDFSQLDEAPVMSRLRELDAKFVELPELDGTAMYKVDRLGASFWAAIHGGDTDGLKPLERQRVKLWLDRAYRQIDALGDAI